MLVPVDRDELEALKTTVRILTQTGGNVDLATVMSAVANAEQIAQEASQKAEEAKVPG